MIVAMTKKIALDIAHDAGDRSMRAAGRKKWNRQDWQAAVDTFNEIWVEPVLLDDVLNVNVQN